MQGILSMGGAKVLVFLCKWVGLMVLCQWVGLMVLYSFIIECAVLYRELTSETVHQL